MKKHYTIIICLLAGLLFMAGKLNAQNIIFQEDFEFSPVTSITNTGYGDLPDGSSPCGRASRGTTSDFNSTNVDFKSSENSTYFLGVNPESPCGGFYEAYLDGPTLDMSSLSNPYFKCRYFIGDGLNYGYTGITVEFNNGSTTHQIYTEFTERNSWTDFEITLPSEMIHPTIEIILYMGGGEGVGLDDFTIQDGPTPVCENNSSEISETACTSFTFDGEELTISGQYMATLTNTAGCDSLVTLNLTIVDTPDATVTKDGVSLNAVENSSYTYQWLDCDNGNAIVNGATSSLFIPSSSGNYAVEVSEGDCMSVSDCALIDWVTSFDKNESEKVQIYPNTTTGLVNIDLTNNVVQPVIQIWNMSGSLLEQFEPENINGSFQINMPFRNGIYLIKVYHEGNLLTTKRIIKSN